MANLQIVALDTATPQLRAPGAGDGYSAPRSVFGVDGTTASPTYSFTNSPTTGLIRSAADAIGVVTAGTERWVFNASGAFNPVADATYDIGTALVRPRDLTLSRTLTTASITMAGNISAAAWTTSGIGIKTVARTFTDTSSSGTVAAAYTNVLGGNTIAASSSTTYTEYGGVYLGTPVAGTNVTITNAFSLVTAGGIKTPALTANQVTLSGNVSSAAWTTGGVGLKHVARTFTDTSSSGTVAAAYTNVLGGNTVAASSAVTFTEYGSLQLGSPTAGTNVTITNPYSLVTAGAIKSGGAVTANNGTLTTSAPVLDLAQTWNASGTTFTGYKLNVTDTASASGSSIMDLQVGGTSIFKVRRASFSGTKYDRTVVVLPQYNYTAIPLAGFMCFGIDENSANFVINSGAAASIDLQAGSTLRWKDSPTNAVSGTADLTLSRKAAANFQLGANDAAAPVAQTIGPQSVVAGTSNTAGADFTIRGSQGTGTGAGGSIIFQTAAAGSSGTSQNSLSNRLVLSASNARAEFSGNVYLNNNLQFATGAYISCPSSGVLKLWNAAANDSARLNFGGDTSSFPSLKRSTTILQARLADDSDYATYQGKIQTHANAVSETPSATHTITIYDGGGTAYKVLCVAA